MTDKMIYAGLADAVYGQKNEDSIPPGWTQIVSKQIIIFIFKYK